MALKIENIPDLRDRCIYVYAALELTHVNMHLNYSGV